MACPFVVLCVHVIYIKEINLVYSFLLFQANSEAMTDVDETITGVVISIYLSCIYKELSVSCSNS